MHPEAVPEADVIARRRFRRNSWKCRKRPGSNMTLAIWTDVIALMRVQLRPFQGRRISPDSYRWWSVCAPPPANCLQASGLRTKGVALDIPLTIVLALVVEGRSRGRRRTGELRIYITKALPRSHLIWAFCAMFKRRNLLPRKDGPQCKNTAAL
jgi:hypothetical protein